MASTYADLAQDDCRPNPTPSGRLRRDPAAHRAILEGRSYQKGPKELEFAEREAVESMYVDSFKDFGDMRAYRAAKRIVKVLWYSEALTTNLVLMKGLRKSSAESRPVP